MMIKHNLNKYKSNVSSKVFSGRDRGEKVRREIKLDQFDSNNDVMEIIFPEDTISLNSSFFLGLFGESIRNLGEFEFKSKYKFNASPKIQKSINDGIDRAQKTGNPLDFDF